MDRRTFNNAIELCHRLWLAENLDLASGVEKRGIDLIGDKVAVELKCRYEGSPATTWTIDAKQIERYVTENPDKELFWAFLEYDLSQTPKQVRSARNLGSKVIHREVKLVHWSFVDGLRVHTPRTGPYVYVSIGSLPKKETFKEVRVEGGVLYLPKGSILEDRIVA